MEEGKWGGRREKRGKNIYMKKGLEKEIEIKKRNEECVENTTILFCLFIYF